MKGFSLGERGALWSKLSLGQKILKALRFPEKCPKKGNFDLKKFFRGPQKQFFNFSLGGGKKI